MNARCHEAENYLPQLRFYFEKHLIGRYRISSSQHFDDELFHSGPMTTISMFALSSSPQSTKQLAFPNEAPSRCLDRSTALSSHWDDKRLKSGSECPKSPFNLAYIASTHAVPIFHETVQSAVMPDPICWILWRESKRLR
jgi:hypothetical protein